ncbi:uncharacterized protein JN550_003469 [Neoarthrinium moseri]|nr:uncharacterized protein JN550_003469 [Neoarthrinium moseri]KAI1873216.1 hypothetical protein JN550_003469 [Neoarthrinium moseri]
MALMAAMTLVLAHLDSHRDASSLLVHQYLSDRAMMEQAQQSMEELSRRNGDSLSTESADLLRRLLVIEAEASDGHKGRTEHVSIQPQEVEAPYHNENDHGNGVVRVSIPYFGIIKIARGGIMSKEILELPDKPAAAQDRQAPTPETMGVNNPASAQKIYTQLTPQPSQSAFSSQATDLGNSYSPNRLSALAQDQSRNQAMPNVQTAIEDMNYTSVRSHSLDCSYAPYLPDIAAGVNDWTFQGVDMAFFESLASGDANSANFHANVLDWQNSGT